MSVTEQEGRRRRSTAPAGTASGGAPSGQPCQSPSGQQQRMLSRAPTHAFTECPDGFSGEDGGDGPLMGDESELVSSSLAPIVPIIRAANEIEEENPQVTYLSCSVGLLDVMSKVRRCGE